MILKNEQEYYQELIRLTKRKLELYCKAAVETAGNGTLAKIRGKLLFETELGRLCEEEFSPEEINQYRIQMQRMHEKDKMLRERAYAFMSRGQVIGLEYLYRMFGVNELERHLIGMSLAAELDPQFERVFCLLQDDYSLKMPTPDLGIRILSLDAAERLGLSQQFMERLKVLSIFFEGLDIKTDQNREKTGFLTTPLKLRKRILVFIRDITSFDEELADLVTLHTAGAKAEPPVIRRDEPQRLKRLLERTEGQRFLYISGSKGIGKKTLVKNYCRETGRMLLSVNTKRLLESPKRAEKLECLLRESRLLGRAWICFEDAELPEEPDDKCRELEDLLWLLRDYEGIPIFTSENVWQEFVETGSRQCLNYHLNDTNGAERKLLWENFLKAEEWPADLESYKIAEKYELTPGGIRRSAEEARQQMLILGKSHMTAKMLYAACQKQLVHKLGKDAVRIKSPYQWDDLILSEANKNLLRDACNQVEYQGQVYRDWGFADKVAYGRGTSMIFYGPPGTGKTMGAQVMANELNLELYKVNMAGVMSRYVGESEKKLEQIFEQGKKSQSILFFDEADVLFGKRSETKDAQDKYANASTAYLLQKVEEYPGILILATNFLQNFDNAFCRRFKFIIEFPFPEPESRKAIWENVFPIGLEKDGEIDSEWLAEEFKLSGSQIKNIALAASFLAAGEKRGLHMRHILIALKREQLKVGKQMITSDFGKYYYLME